MKQKKLTTCLCTIIMLCILISPALAAAPAPLSTAVPTIKSASAVVMDVNSGAVLLEKNSAEMGQPSSLTKLMTAYIAFSELNPGATITCSSAAATQNFPTAANVGYRQGDSYHVSDALTGMLMASAEDCAYSLAEKVSGSMEGFADKMNMYAKATTAGT